MTLASLNRWKASALHLAISAVIATTVVALMLALWYPQHYFAAMGGATLVLLLIGIDVVVGPLFTLIVYDPKKKNLRFDLAVIAALQLAALAYGCSIMFNARPVYSVFVVDRFEVVAANYVARRLDPHYPVLYSGPGGLVAHECILDLRPLKEASDVAVDDVAKRLIDYGFHAPTMSFPVAGTLMVEPTESESKAELDRFVDAMIAIRGEIRAVEEGRADRVDNVLKHAPHTAAAVTADDWTHRYRRSEAAYPVASLVDAKYWPPVARVDNVYGDRNLFCSCLPVSAAESA